MENYFLGKQASYNLQGYLGYLADTEMKKEIPVKPISLKEAINRMAGTLKSGLN